MAANISTLIPNTEIDEKLIIRMNTAIKSLMTDYATTTVNVTPAMANKYIGDLYGLLKDVVGVPLDGLYPNMVANGYNAPNEYDGSKETFIILNSYAIDNYITLFKS